MARTKQTARKTDKDGKLTAASTGNTRGTPTPALQSPGGQNIATFPRRTGRLLESDSELEQAVAMFGVGSPPARSTRSQMPIRGISPARGSPRRGTPGCGHSPARSSLAPARGSPRGGTPGRGRSPVRGTPGRSPGRGAPVDPKLKPVGMVNPQVKPSTSGITPGRPGQAGYVNRGRGGGSGRGASRSSPARYDLPSFSTEDDDDDNDDNNGDDDAEEDMEVDFLNLGQPPAPTPRR